MEPTVPDPLMPDLLTVLSNVTPCDCGSRTRIVKGHGVRAPGFVDLQCPPCGAMSVMRPGDVDRARAECACAVASAAYTDGMLHTAECPLMGTDLGHREAAPRRAGSPRGTMSFEAAK